MSELTIDDVDLLKKAAEARKLDAEARLAEKEIELRDVAIRHQLAEAVKEEQYAVTAGISRKERERAEAMTLAMDHFHHQYLFDGPVSGKTVYAALTTLNTWHRIDPNADWEIVINSPGGSVIDGMHLFDQITSYSQRGGGTHHITITVRGYAASMAGILLQAADLRRCGPESYVMIHEISSYAQGKIGELEDEINFLKRISERVVNIFVARSAEAAKKGRKVKALTSKDFEKNWNRTDWWLDSREAFSLGIIDEIG